MRWLHRNYEDASDMEKQAIEEELTKRRNKRLLDQLLEQNDDLELINYMVDN